MVILVAGTCESLVFESEYEVVVRDLATPENGIEARRQLVVLRRDAGGVTSGLPVVVEARGAADLAVLLVVLRAVVAHRDQRCRANRDCVRTESERLGHVRARADPAGDDELDLTVHPELFQCVHGEPGRRQRGDADVLDEDVLRCRRSALHAVDTNASAPAFPASWT